MKKLDVKDAYLNWMYDLVSDDEHPISHSYHLLFKQLYDIPFIYTIELDGNRYQDGVDFRYKFGADCRYPQAVIASGLDCKDCSVLEMMVALAYRCEQEIMFDPEFGNRTGLWFWSMIENLGLGDMDDDNYSTTKVYRAIRVLLNHDYAPNGKGGLFTVQRYADAREVEIWYQMNSFLNENYFDKNF